MRNFIAAGTAVVLAITSGVAGQGGCRVNKDIQEAGNNYCDAVKHIHYTNVSMSGTYNKVVDMTGCKTAPKTYGGPMAPFDEELSMHFNGPLELKKFAVYTPGSSQKRSVKPSIHQRRHNHQHFHEHNKEIRAIQEREAKGEEVTVTMDGKVQHWVNQYGGDSPAAPASTTAPAAGNSASPATSVEQAPSAAPSFNAGTGSWGRQAYYSAADGIREGLVFLIKAGEWDDRLRYASADGSSTTASPTTLQDTQIADESEIVIMSDKLCSGDECGAFRQGSVVHHGFGGAQKAFLMEFSMPITKNSGRTGKYEKKHNQPKIWALNAHIPRTGQFGGCSCWLSGCGEFDIFETLNEGGTRCKSTFHAGKMGGNSDYFERPTANTITLAVVFTGDSGSAHIKVLDADHSYDKSLGASDLEALTKEDQATSVFDVSKLPNANGDLPW